MMPVRLRPGVRLLALFAAAALTHGENPPSPALVPLGSPAYHASPERPFGWRGDGSGRFPGATPVTEWSAIRNVRWSTVIGTGYASPILTEECAFVLSEPNLLTCLSRADGQIRWQLALTPDDLPDPQIRKAIQAYKPPKDGSGLAAATPVTDGQQVYVLLANGLLSAVDLAGKKRWSLGIDVAPSTGYGRSASPLLIGGKLVVHLTNLYAFDPATGRRLWVNTATKSSYGTPASYRIANIDFILTPLGDLVRATDGKTVNSDLAHTAHSSPIAGEGLAIFGDATVTALRIDPTLQEEPIWTAPIAGEVFGSPLLHDGTLFLTTGEGELYAFDSRGHGALDPLTDPLPLFEHPDSTPAAYASLSLAGPYLFLTSNSGETTVLETTPKPRIIAHNKLPSGTGSSPVFSGSAIYIRDGDRLYCLGK